MMRARRRYGQHFLESAWVVKLLDAIQPAADDRFLEIGPGHGAITAPLAAHAQQVVAVEVDRDLSASLKARGIPNLTVVTADVLEVDLGSLAQSELKASPDSPVRIVGNLPYNISSPILFRLLKVADTTRGVRDATLMLQKEVAERLTAKVGTSEYGVLTILTALGAEVTQLLSLPPGAFRPVPKVRSVVVRLTFRPPAVAIRDPELIVNLVRSTFTQRRKTMSNAMAVFAETHGVDAKALLAAAGIDPKRRPQTLTLADFGRLADAFSSP